MTWTNLADESRMPLVKIIDIFELDGIEWAQVLMWDPEKQLVEKFIQTMYLREFYSECEDREAME